MLEACNFIKKETLAQVFSCQFCEISKNTFSYITTPVAASMSLNGYFDLEIKGSYQKKMHNDVLVVFF